MLGVRHLTACGSYGLQKYKQVGDYEIQTSGKLIDPFCFLLYSGLTHDYVTPPTRAVPLPPRRRRYGWFCVSPIYLPIYQSKEGALSLFYFSLKMSVMVTSCVNYEFEPKK
jgi:hypothetical protein